MFGFNYKRDKPDGTRVVRQSRRALVEAHAEKVLRKINFRSGRQ